MRLILRGYPDRSGECPREPHPQPLVKRSDLKDIIVNHDFRKPMGAGERRPSSFTIYSFQTMDPALLELRAQSVAEKFGSCASVHQRCIERKRVATSELNIEQRSSRHDGTK